MEDFGDIAAALAAAESQAYPPHLQALFESPISTVRLEQLFFDFLQDVRWKNDAKKFLKVNVIHFRVLVGQPFEHIFMSVVDVVLNAKGIGILGAYNITTVLCSFEVPNVYILGGGPKKALEILSIFDKCEWEGVGRYRRKFIPRDVLVNAIFTLHRVEITENNFSNDQLETTLCVWQKQGGRFPSRPLSNRP